MTEMHDQWMAHYGRVYTDADEKNRRSTIFQQNLKYIHTFNKANSKPYKLGFNEFADLTDEEFTKSRNRFKSHICATSTNLFRYEMLLWCHSPWTGEIRKMQLHLSRIRANVVSVEFICDDL